MDLETAMAIVETMIEAQNQVWDEDYLSEDEHKALIVAMGCMKSIWYAKKAING